MQLRRRHAVALFQMVAIVLTATALSGASCLGDDAGGAEERAECEAVCAAEAQCDFGRSEAACVSALCADDGFLVVKGAAPAEGEGEGEGEAGDDADADADLEALSSNECISTAEDCGEIALCSCADACARVDECTGSSSGDCVDSCENLIEQDPNALYLENRCKMESTCADLAACGGVSG